MKEKSRKSEALRICMTAVFAALACVCTFIAVPLPIGYFNLGDICVILSAYFIGPIYGAIASGIGCALADVLTGYVAYAPATLIIKALMVVAAYFIYRAMRACMRSDRTSLAARIVAALGAEAIMVGGYFVFEAFILGFGMGAVASIAGNTLQGVAGIVGSTFIATAVYSSKTAREYFDF